MNNRFLIAALGACLCLPAAHAATIVIINDDAQGEGFNDPTPVIPVGNNRGTTLGQQRLNVFQAAADRWGAVLDSNVIIRVRARFDPLDCNAIGAVLGSAGPYEILRDFPNAPIARTWFSAAQANALSGIDNSPGDDVSSGDDIIAIFNASIDTSCLLGATGWWYGTARGNVPADRIALMPVVIHEIAHGLGFLTYTEADTGAMIDGLPSVWDSFLTDANLAGGTHWSDMGKDVDRLDSAIDDPDLVWAGDHVNERARGYLDPTPVLWVKAPATLVGAHEVQTASFGPPAPISGVHGEVVEALDGTPPAFDACEPLTNADAVGGRIVLVDRGLCDFTVKVANAQAVGAIGVLVANNAATGMPEMGGTDPIIAIPSFGIDRSLGEAIRRALATEAVDATLGYDISRLAGTTDGKVRMHAPPSLEPGSSVSHFSSAAGPDLLMEPAISSTLFSDTDLTVPLFRDILWPILDGAIANIAPTISIAPRFSAPVNAPVALSEVFFADVDAGDDALTVTFSVDSGTLSAAPATGVEVKGNRTSETSVTGARMVLLPYIVGGNVTFESERDDLSDVSLLVEVDDNGNNGTGGPKTAGAESLIAVTADVSLDPITN